MALETIGADKYYVCKFDYDGEYSIIFKGTVYDKEQQSIDLTGNIGDCTFVAMIIGQTENGVAIRQKVRQAQKLR